jgi:hypothetical protein
MDRRQFFGDSVVATLIRLVVLSIAVGVVFSVLGITPNTLVARLGGILRRLLDVGIDSFGWALNYFLLGAVVVFPIWFLVRLLSRKPPAPRA